MLLGGFPWLEIGKIGSKSGQNPEKRLEKRLRNGSGTVRTSMDGTALTGWMYSSTMEDGTPGATWVAQILGCPCMGALAPKNGCKMAIGRGCVRPPPGPETAQKRLKLAIKTASGTRNCYFQLDRPAWVSENVFCTPGAPTRPPTALPNAKKTRNTQKRY